MAPPLVRRGWFQLGMAVAVAFGMFVLVWFQPQKLFLDERADEAIPTASAPVTSAPSTPDGSVPTAAVEQGPTELARGEFVSLDHGTTGSARVLELADGSRIVRLEDLDTDNGPDLFLYLTSNPADGEEGAFDEDFVSLGRLTANQGDQNYDLPAELDLAEYSTVVIWCDRFNSAFGAADLALA